MSLLVDHEKVKGRSVVHQKRYPKQSSIRPKRSLVDSRPCPRETRTIEFVRWSRVVSFRCALGATLPRAFQVDVQVRSHLELKYRPDISVISILFMSSGSVNPDLRHSYDKGTLDLRVSNQRFEESPILYWRRASTPMDINYKLCACFYESDTLLPNPEYYHCLVGKLIYLTVTRPDILFVVGVVSRFIHAPRTSHLQAAERILRYLKSAPGHGLIYKPSLYLSLPTLMLIILDPWLIAVPQVVFAHTLVHILLLGEVLKNNCNGSIEGSLLHAMDHTCTSFGSRLLKHWVSYELGYRPYTKLNRFAYL
ncbi:hypothetical protein KSP39_PZI004028 [Platanthera zijinensis]|uniref:DNA mismatch repair protein MutS core domain-containing protein n=1 Tax=Platanthera zijinensis TaxID=2320716 RepID=A0AAP0GCY4_9ASPA